MSDNFWTDELVKKFYDYISTEISSAEHKGAVINNFKEQINYRNSKQLLQKDWEILSFVGEWFGRDDAEYKFDVTTNYFFPEVTKPEDAKYRYSYTYQDLFDKGAKIKSVRRISDNSIWSIDDETQYGRIAYFTISGTEMCAVHHVGGTFSNINFLKKVKQPLFTTSDGKPIYEGDDYWRVDGEFSHYMVTNPRYHRWESEKYFSTEDACEEFILMNKPCLSLSDVISKYEFLKGNLEAFNYELKELIKQK